MTTLPTIKTHLELSDVGALSIRAFCLWSSISRAQFYLEWDAGRIEPRKVGRRTLIPVQEACRWLDSLPVSGAK